MDRVCSSLFPRTESDWAYLTPPRSPLDCSSQPQCPLPPSPMSTPSRRSSESVEPSRAVIHLQQNSPAASQPASAHASRSPSRSPQASRSPSQQRRAAAADPLSALIDDVRNSPQRKPRAAPRSPSAQTLDEAAPTHQVTFHHEAATASAAEAAAPAPAAPAAASASSSSSSQPLSQSGYIFGPRSPIEGASIFSMLTVNWATPLVVLGNKRPLDDRDVPEVRRSKTQRAGASISALSRSRSFVAFSCAAACGGQRRSRV